MASRRVTFGAGMAALALAAGGIALPFYSSRTLDADLKALVEQGGAGHDYMLRNLKHEAGIFASKGAVDLELRSRCSVDEDEPFVVHVDYTVSHLPGFSGLNSFAWAAAPQGEPGVIFAKLFGANGKLSGKGAVTYGGAISSDMELPEISATNNGTVLQVPPSKGTLAVGKTSLQFAWQLDRTVARGSGQALEVKQVRLNMDIRNRQLGTGNLTLSVDTASASQFSLEGLKISSETTESGGKLDSRFGQSIRKLQFSDQTLRELELEATLKGVHSKSIETLTTLFSDTCGFSDMTVDEGKAARRSLRTLLASGFSFGISKLTGSSQAGGIDGSFLVEVLPAKSNDTVSFADQLKSSGQVIVKGNLLPADKKQLALSTGYVTETAEGLKAGYAYADGLLKVNDKALDGGMVRSQLEQMDKLVNAFLEADGVSARAKPAEVEKPEAVGASEVEPPPANDKASAEPAMEAPAAPPVAPVTAPAAPASTSPADCSDIQACVTRSIQAAMREDIGMVRKLASQIDTLPKPDLGNKAQGRKLNGQALEALKADDYSGAVGLLQSALKENPRDVEIAANLGFAMVKAGRFKEAATVLGKALLLDPRRTSSWAPMAEALALSGRQKDAAAALWVAYQWSANREKSEIFYMERAEKEAATRPALAQMYRTVHAWVTEGRRPDF